MSAVTADPLADLFEKHIRRPDSQDPDGCWVWAGSLSSDGKPVMRQKKAGSDEPQMLGHRWAYEHYVGAIPPNGTIRQKCNNPKCCRPEHLFMPTGFRGDPAPVGDPVAASARLDQLLTAIAEAGPDDVAAAESAVEEARRRLALAEQVRDLLAGRSRMRGKSSNARPSPTGSQVAFATKVAVWLDENGPAQAPSVATGVKLDLALVKKLLVLDWFVHSPRGYSLTQEGRAAVLEG